MLRDYLRNWSDYMAELSSMPIIIVLNEIAFEKFWFKTFDV